MGDNGNCITQLMSEKNFIKRKKSEQNLSIRPAYSWQPLNKHLQMNTKIKTSVQSKATSFILIQLQNILHANKILLRSQ